ncbi:hypothetical protein [Streptomyces albidoflavus]|uniref:hypothetical protein n=1 Tax=Streptomyces albidoflavus TaxID=1886 RepID=UPI00101E5182|nr:hypothetical protein [Streptomyces albidoflavus]RZD82179.1 hypothetical protein C0Q63_22275 [Streptomyces albidoflavus]
MPAPTPDTIRSLTETLADLTDHLRENPAPSDVLALVEPLLDEYTGLPVQLADTLRALARAVQEHPDTPRTPQGALLLTDLRTAAWELSDQHTLHYVLDDLRGLYGSSPTRGPESCRCR